MFITSPSNIDYLMDDVRLRVGDTDGTRFSDALVRTSLVSSVKQLQRRWKNRYLVFKTTMIVSPLPEGYVYEVDSDDSNGATVIPSGYLYGAVIEGYAIIPSGLSANDVLRNPYHTFTDPSIMVISQEDEFPIVLLAAIILRTSYLTSSAEAFQSWSDGEYSFSNISAQRTLGGLLDTDIGILDAYFKKRLVSPIRSDFPAEVY